MIKKNFGKTLGLASAMFWGLDTVLISLVLVSNMFVTYGSASTFISTYFHDVSSLTLLLILIIVRKQLKALIQTLFSKSGLIIILASLLGGPIGMTAYVVSLQFLEPSLAASISSIYPIFGLFLSYLLIKEKISLRTIAGTALSVSAIILMSISTTNQSSNLLYGILLAIICVIGWGSEVVIISIALKDDVSSEIALSIRQFVTVIIYSTIIMPIIGGYSHVINSVVSGQILLLILLSGIIGTLSYLCYYKSISIVGPSVAMSLNISYPAWAFLFQILLTNYQFTITDFSFILLLIFGAIISSLTNSKEASEG